MVIIKLDKLDQARKRMKSNDSIQKNQLSETLANEKYMLKGVLAKLDYKEEGEFICVQKLNEGIHKTHMFLSLGKIEGIEVYNHNELDLHVQNGIEVWYVTDEDLDEAEKDAWYVGNNYFRPNKTGGTIHMQHGYKFHAGKDDVESVLQFYGYSYFILLGILMMIIPYTIAPKILTVLLIVSFS